MMRSIKSMMMGGAILLGLAMCFTSCEGTLDDVFGEWSRPTGNNNNDNTKTSVTSIELNKETLELAVGETGQLTATVSPDNATDKTVEWSSDNTDAATVDANGLVTAVAMGTATITAKAGDKSATCEVTVTPGLSTPLTVEAITAGKITVSFPNAGMQYSKNGGAKINMTDNPTEISVAAGDKVAFYGTSTSYNSTVIGGADDGGTFKCKVYGNIMSLLYEDFADKTALPNTNTFQSLFDGNTKLTDASGLLLPATTLAANCYDGMFRSCSNLITAPKKLPAMDLTGANECYYLMFSDCAKLTTAPELPAETLATSCYGGMFIGCSELTTAPELPAPTLVEACYNQMFYDCSSLNSVTCLATSGFDQSYVLHNWLKGVSTTGTFTKSSSTSPSPAWTSGISGIPTDWTVNSAP